MSADQAHRTVGILLMTLLLLLSGCASSPKPEETTPAQGPGEIPIPPGFRKIEEDSVFIAFGGFQAGLVVYQGKREPPWVVEFYRGILPSQGWTLVASFISKDAILVFTKERQACVISISGDSSATRLEVRLGVIEPVIHPAPSKPQPSPAPRR